MYSCEELFEKFKAIPCSLVITLVIVKICPNLEENAIFHKNSFFSVRKGNSL